MTRFFTLCAEPQPKHSGWFCYCTQCTQAHESWVLLEHSSQALGDGLGFVNVSV